MPPYQTTWRGKKSNGLIVRLRRYAKNARRGLNARTVAWAWLSSRVQSCQHGPTWRLTLQLKNRRPNERQHVSISQTCKHYTCQWMTKSPPLPVELAEVQMAKTNATTCDSKNAGQVQTAEDAAALAAAEQAVEDAREVVRLVAAEFNAGKLHETIVRYTEIAKALGPEGVRAKMMEDGLRKLNAGLVAIASEAGWPAITVGSGTSSVFVGDRPVALCSASQSVGGHKPPYNLRLAQSPAARLWCLDRADLLDSELTGNGLEKCITPRGWRRRVWQYCYVRTTDTQRWKKGRLYPQVAIKKLDGRRNGRPQNGRNAFAAAGYALDRDAVAMWCSSTDLDEQPRPLPCDAVPPVAEARIEQGNAGGVNGHSLEDTRRSMRRS